MKPPRPNDDYYGREVAHIVRDRPGISFAELVATTGLFQHEALEVTKALVTSGIIEHRDGFRIRERKRKPKPEAPTSFWSRLRGLFAPQKGTV